MACSPTHSLLLHCPELSRPSGPSSGDMEGRVHLIRWDWVTMPHGEGGLGGCNV